MKKIHFKSIDSTNIYGKNYIRENDSFHNTLIVADRQTNGKGRLTKSFHSENGLYFSLLLDTRNKDYPLTLACAVAVCETFNELYNIELKIKWVNDLLYKNKKVCGILAESIIEKDTVKGFVCGIGINTKEVILPDELKDLATILPVENNEEITTRICEKIVYMYENNISPIDKYKSNLILNVPVRVHKNNETLFFGIARDISDNGNLLVEENGITHALNSGEISIKFEEKDEIL